MFSVFYKLSLKITVEKTRMLRSFRTDTPQNGGLGSGTSDAPPMVSVHSRTVQRQKRRCLNQCRARIPATRLNLCAESNFSIQIRRIDSHYRNFSFRQVSEKVLSSVCRPLYSMLSKWLLDGEIGDPCQEFFIETRNVNTAERLWHDKYYVR